MKQFLIFTFSILCLSAFSQNLNLRNPTKKDIELPQKLNKNDIAIIYEIHGGWSAYDYLNYYIVDERGNIKSYSAERPKTYLKNEKLKKTIKNIEITPAKKHKIIELIKSKQLSDLLQYNQEDFKIKIEENHLPPCYISDANGYKLTFIQNNKQNSYNYYAPKYMLEKCVHKTINKVMLKKFVEVLDLLYKME